MSIESKVSTKRNLSDAIGCQICSQSETCQAEGSPELCRYYKNSPKVNETYIYGAGI